MIFHVLCRRPHGLFHRVEPPRPGIVIIMAAGGIAGRQQNPGGHARGVNGAVGKFIPGVFRGFRVH
ncbi:hypothetical protein [Xenorhabdus bovienii]|uniref:hypothetical protein n=1 Tax=Xenorhabdus bovienii TaxID=40576 RepID=UPI0023B2D580|nr:hypothetical protein [Xenorhabdus bovienii]MDE9532338.1 hypothetical protein [Xenorhabdus bovienii]